MYIHSVDVRLKIFGSTMEISVENFQKVKMDLPLEAAKHPLAYTHKPRHPSTEITFFSHVSCHFIHNAYEIVANQISFK